MKNTEDRASNPTTASSSMAADGTTTRSTSYAAATFRAMKNVIAMVIWNIRWLFSGYWVFTPATGKSSRSIDHDPQQAMGELGPAVDTVNALPSNSIIHSRHYGDHCKAEDDYDRVGVEVRTPHKGELVHTHPSEEFRTIDTYWIKDSSGEMHQIASELLPRLASQAGGKLKVAHIRMALTTTVGGSLFLWPVNLHPGSFWTPSASGAIREASKGWTEICRDGGCYSWSDPLAISIKPAWPYLKVAQILEMAFYGRCIDSLNDPLLKTLRTNRKSK